MHFQDSKRTTIYIPRVLKDSTYVALVGDAINEATRIAGGSTVGENNYGKWMDQSTGEMVGEDIITITFITHADSPEKAAELAKALVRVVRLLKDSGEKEVLVTVDKIRAAFI